MASFNSKLQDMIVRHLGKDAERKTTQFKSPTMKRLEQYARIYGNDVVLAACEAWARANADDRDRIAHPLNAFASVVLKYLDAAAGPAGADAAGLAQTKEPALV
jgi:hypothetical protein